jgi:ABC-2 type transport system permease protein
MTRLLTPDAAALLRAEWRRFFARRLTTVMLVLTLLVLALAGYGVGHRSHPHTAAGLARAQAFIAGQRAQNLDLCLSDVRTGTAGPEGQPPPTEAECRQRAEHFQPSVEEFQGYQFTYGRDMSTLLVLLGGLLALFGFVLGASFVGAEWSSGGMMTVLVWRPRRMEVLAGKLAALLLGVGALTLAVSAAWSVAMWVVAHQRGDARLTPGLLASLALRDTRVLALTLACAAAGFAIACYGRHTAAALGTAVGYLVTVEVVARIALSAAQVARPQRFYLSSYMVSWLNNSTSYTDMGPCRPPDFGPVCPGGTWSIGAGLSATVLAAILIATLLATAAGVRRRDVT